MGSIGASQVEKTLKDEGVKFIRMAFVDMGNIVRFRVVPVPRFLDFLKPRANPPGLLMNTSVMALNPHNGWLVNGLPPCVGVAAETILVPDVKSLRKLPYGSGSHAICMVDLKEKNGDGVPFPCCARTCVKNVLRTAEEMELTFLVGFESELMFLSSLDPLTPVDNFTYCASAGFRSEQTCKMLDEVFEAIEALGIGVCQYHKEHGPGQFEYVTDPYTPLEAADNLVLTRETIHNIAAKYGISATFAPKPFGDGPGNRAHCHISITGLTDKYDNLENGPNAPAGLTGLEERFLAGILKHLRALAAFTLPTVSSYDRVQNGCFSGVYVGWGVDNKELTLRLCYPPTTNPLDRKFHFEIKCVDATANPYLALAAIITAGLDGVSNDLLLDSKEITAAPSSYTEEERKELGLISRLPHTIQESITALKEDYQVFSKGMGKYQLDLYIACIKYNAKYMEGLDQAGKLKEIIRIY